MIFNFLRRLRRTYGLCRDEDGDILLYCPPSVDQLEKLKDLKLEITKIKLFNSCNKFRDLHHIGWGIEVYVQVVN